MNPFGIAAAAIPALCVGYGVLEARFFRTRKYSIPALPEGAQAVSILQVSDLHFRLSMRKLEDFVRSLANETYDLVIATGDLLGEPRAVDRCVEILNGLKASRGRYFVLGASDYYAPVLKNYFDYFLRRRRIGARRNPTDRLRAGLLDGGWTDLNNITLFTDIDGHRWQITGLDDPNLRRDDRTLLVRDSSADFALCVVHDPAPYAEIARAGFDLVVAGHTHGGQVRLPFLGAVVTNSELPRRYARGLHRMGGTWLFVSPGLGTGKYAPFRFMCPPEASILELSSHASK